MSYLKIRNLLWWCLWRVPFMKFIDLFLCEFSWLVSVKDEQSSKVCPHNGILSCQRKINQLIKNLSNSPNTKDKGEKKLRYKKGEGGRYKGDTHQICSIVILKSSLKCFTNWLMCRHGKKNCLLPGTWIFRDFSFRLGHCKHFFPWRGMIGWSVEGFFHTVEVGCWSGCAL